MKFTMPQEIEVWYIIPAIRREFALIMHKNGLLQKDIAKKLGITEPAVSQYLRHKRAINLKFDANTEKEIENSVKKILNKSNVISETQHMCNFLKKNLTICKIHKGYDTSLPKNCRLCMVR